MSDARLIGDSGEHYTRHCPGQSAVAFCASVAHPEQVTERFRKARYRALSIDGTTDRDERRAAIVCLGSGRLEVLTACEIVSEGLDIPDIAASILLRPTQSLGLHLQQVGWSLRTASGKARAVILDYAGNTLRHGLPNAHRSWSLDSHKRRAMATAATPVRQCPACFALVAVATLSCTACGEVFEGGQVMLRMAAGKLVEISERARERASLLMRLRALLYREAVLWANGACDRLESVAEARSYKRGWVYHEVQRARDAAISLARTG